jgi:hypothetical protein
MVKRTPRVSHLILLFGLALPGMAQRANSLTVAGRPDSARVVQVAGRNYVDVESLTRILNGSISFAGSQIVLDLRGQSADQGQAEAGFSKGFITAGIEAMAQQREWHAALRNAIEGSFTLNEHWLSGFRARAQQALTIASASAKTDSDRDALPLLTNQFNNMSQLSDKYLQMSVSRTYIDARALESDPLDQKIVNCSRALASMATADQLTADASCR